MIVTIGTKNKAKVKALEEALDSFEYFQDFEIKSYAVRSGVSDQPLSIEETIQGAKNRALRAYSTLKEADYSFGVESGLFKAPGTQTGYLHISVCAIFDGQNYSIGTSTGFEVPSPILKHIIEDKLNLSQACIKNGISNNENIGQEEGLVGILTNGRVNRKEYTIESILAALTQITYKNLVGG